MPRTTIDLSEARSFEAVEPQVYPMTIDALSDPFRSSGEKQTLGIDVTFRFDDPAVDQRAGTVRKFYPIEGRGAGFFREFWKAATGEDLPIGQPIDINTDDAVGRPVLASVVNTPGKSDPTKLYNNIDRVTAR